MTDPKREQLDWSLIGGRAVATPPASEWIDGVELWRVDGGMVRDLIDVEFTNSAHGLEEDYVGRDEVWVDREAPGSGETVVWALRAAFERYSVIHGLAYDQVYTRGVELETTMRLARRGSDRPDFYRGDADAAWLTKHGAVTEALLALGPARVSWMNGAAVRDWQNLEWTLGGNWQRDKWIPEGEIWLDDASVVGDDALAVVLHEATEARIMGEGIDYEKAHLLASQIERVFRAQLVQERQEKLRIIRDGGGR